MCKKIIWTKLNTKKSRKWKNIISTSTRGSKISPTVLLAQFYSTTSWKTFMIAFFKILINTSKNTLMSSFSLRQIIHKLRINIFKFLKTRIQKTCNENNDNSSQEFHDEGPENLLANSSRSADCVEWALWPGKIKKLLIPLQFFQTVLILHYFFATFSYLAMQKDTRCSERSSNIVFTSRLNNLTKHATTTYRSRSREMSRTALERFWRTLSFCTR